MNKKKKSKSLSYAVLIVFFLSTVFLAVATSYLFLQNKVLSSEFETNNNARENLESELEYHKKKSSADDFFIEGQYDNAMKGYQELAVLGVNRGLLEERQVALAEELKLRTAFDSAQSKGKMQVSWVRKLMEEELSAMELEFQHRYDSLNKEMDAELERMQRQLIAKDNLIESAYKSVASAKANANIGTLTFYSTNGTKTTYFGQVINGKANGKGMGYYATGNVYIGDWKDNLKHGDNAVFTWLAGDKYEGSYVKDKREGKGTYYWANGERYEGEWANDTQSGYGILYDREGKIKIKGNWKNGDLVKGN